MILQSRSYPVSGIQFPEYAGRQYYMASTGSRNVALPEPITPYESAVQRLCERLGYAGQVHVTVDEKWLDTGHTQRKPGPHVDGRFSGESWHHNPWAHYCNEVPVPRMAVAVASSVPGCKVYNGDFVGQPDTQGDLSHITDQLGDGVLVPANQWYLLSPDCVHESLPMLQATRRSFIRVAFETVPDVGVL